MLMTKKMFFVFYMFRNEMHKVENKRNYVVCYKQFDLKH